MANSIALRHPAGRGAAVVSSLWRHAATRVSHGANICKHAFTRDHVRPLSTCHRTSQPSLPPRTSFLPLSGSFFPGKTTWSVSFWLIGDGSFSSACKRPTQNAERALNLVSGVSILINLHTEYLTRTQNEQSSRKPCPVLLCRRAAFRAPSTLHPPTRTPWLYGSPAGPKPTM